MITLGQLKDKDVVVYGTGLNAVKCVDLLETHGIKIQYLLDGRNGCGQFKNYSVFSPSAEFLDGKYIVVACKYEIYVQIRERLAGQEEFKEYIYYAWLGKKMVLLHGNCHMDVVEAYLNSSIKFREKYAIYPTPRICSETPVDTNILPHMDVWIHEDIQIGNQFGYMFSDEYLRKFMQGAYEVVIPHLFGLGRGFFPHIRKGVNKRSTALQNGAEPNGIFPGYDEVIEQGIEQGMSVDQICRYVCQDEVISKEFILENFYSYVDKIREREKSWDIKILDFILENYKYEKLFYNQGHPTNVILGKISREILKMLEICDEISSDIDLDAFEVPIYPWICKVLGMEWSEGIIRASKNGVRSREHMGIAEYVREYIWWCYPERADIL